MSLTVYLSAAAVATERPEQLRPERDSNPDQLTVGLIARLVEH